jgi:hypothetical protein
VNALAAAIEHGAGAGDVDGYVNEQVQAFERDYKRLVAGVRERAPQARIVVMNLPNFASLPYRSDDPPAERDLIRRISTASRERRIR